MQGLTPPLEAGPTELEWGAALALAVLLGYLVARRRVRVLPFIPLTLFALYFLSLLLLPLANRVPGCRLESRWCGLIQSILLTWAALRLAVYLFVECTYRFAHRTKLPRLTRDFLLLLFFAGSGFILLRTQGQVNLTGLITTSAVLTMIIGLAVQSTLGNFFSGLAIQMERPFCVGDWITLDTITGKVVNITWKATYLVTRENVQVHIPNSRIDSGIYYNFNRPDPEVLTKLSLGVEYGASPERVRNAIMEVLGQNTKVMKSPAPEIRLIGFGDFAITYQIRYWIEDYADDDRIKAQIYNQLWYALRRHGIKIPFPIRDVHLAHVERRHERALEVEAQDRLPTLLEGVAVLAPLSQEERRQLAAMAERVCFGADEDVVRQGDEGRSMFIILDGACEVLGAHGRVALIEVGGYFGEMSLLTGEVRSATVRATCESTLLRIDKEAFAGILQSNPGIVEELGRVLSERRAALNRKAIPDANGDSGGLIRRIRSFFHL